MKTAALVVAAGSSQRFGTMLPKVYHVLAGQAVINHSLKVFNNHPKVDKIIVVIRAEDQATYQAVVETTDKFLPAVIGGDSRQESVRLGLEALEEFAPDVVLIHDGARPMISADLLDQLLAAFPQEYGVIPAIPVVDTLKRVEESQIISTVPRAHLWRAQTPQAFAYSLILSAHQKFIHEMATDDAALLEMQDIPIKILEGNENNLKITLQHDLEKMEKIMGNPNVTIRSGIGFDTHSFTKGDYVMLGGVKIPHTHGIKAHSDGDVIMHAIVDALLGAAGLGDIGEHFPDTDPQWRGADSQRFLRHVKNLLDENRIKIQNIDVTVLAESPQISPHKKEMIRQIAGPLEISRDIVNIKAGTNEKLGYIGRKEGLSALAIATVLMNNS